MVENGGLLDEIVFIVKTDVKEDLAYLDDILASNDKYSARYQEQGGFDYSQMWNVCEKGNVYVKIDDDVVSTAGACTRSTYFNYSYIALHRGLYHSIHCETQSRAPGVHHRLC